MTNCKPLRQTADPVSVAELKELRARVSRVGEARHAKAERARARASNAITPITQVSPMALPPVSAVITFPVVAPSQKLFVASTSAASVTLRANATVSEPLRILAPALVTAFGTSLAGIEKLTLYMECPNVVRDAADCTLCMTVVIEGNALNAGQFTILPTLGADATTVQPPPQGVTPKQCTITARSELVTISAGAGVTTITTTLAWRNAEKAALPPGYPSPQRGWAYQGNSENLGITLTAPATLGALSALSTYPIDERKPYGSTWTTVRPPGWPKDGPLVATREGTKPLVAAALAQVDALVAVQFPLIMTIPGWREELHATLEHLVLFEGGGRLWAPQQQFDIRPKASAGLTDSLRLDEGPHPRTNGRKTVDGAYRGESVETLSAVGPFQVTTATFRGEAARRRALLRELGDETDYSHKFIWDAPVTYQLLLQMLKLVEDVWLVTSVPSVNTIYPPIYRAMAAYAVNGLGGAGKAFVVQSVAAVSALPPASRTPVGAHVACKQVWDSGTGLPGTWPHFSGFTHRHWNILAGVGDKMALNADSLRARHPEIFAVPAGTLPDKRQRRGS